MRLYQKKILRTSIRQSVDYATESKDAILWDHLPTQRICRVKVQGSDDLVVAYYPEGWYKTPFWLKRGAPVRIAHKGGLRGKIEVVGLGQTKPVSISGDSLPDAETPDDSVITGCLVMQIPNDPQMSVMIKTGTYRIGDDTYTLGPITMGSSSSSYVFGMGGAMNEVAGIINIDAAPGSGYFRYDLIVVGIDDVIDYVKGTAFAEDDDADEPDIPTDHVQLGKILLYAGMTEILDKDINLDYTIPTVAALTVTLSDEDLDWAELTSTITVAVFDQYGRSILAPEYGWYITVEFVSGNGTLTSAEEGDSETKIGGHTRASSNQYVFTYTRNQDAGDISPVLLATLETNYTLTEQFMIKLRDAGGGLMI